MRLALQIWLTPQLMIGLWLFVTVLAAKGSRV